MRFSSLSKLIPLLLIGVLFASTVSPLFAQSPQSLSVSAIVPPTNPNDFQFDFEAEDTTTANPPNKILSYKITYGAKAIVGTTTNTTLVVHWDQALGPNGGQLVEYVMGSATSGYGNTPPIVDFMNKTLTWTIPALPAGTTDQTVQFKLKTTSNYPVEESVNFSLRATMANQYVSIPDKIITQTYQYVTPPPTAEIPAEPTTIVTTAPAQTSHSETNPTTIPNAPTIPPSTSSNPPQQTIQAPPQQVITDVSFTTISQDKTSLRITTKKPAKLLIKFGRSPRTLSESITSNRTTETNSLSIDDLLPATTYYAQIITTDQEGKITNSEIFSFRTADVSSTPKSEDNIAVLTSDGVILLSGNKNGQNKFPTALLTMNTPYEFTYTLKNKLALKSINAVVRNKVLGFNSLAHAQEQTSVTIPMKEKEPFVYVAGLKTAIPGDFEVFVRITDTHGNISEQKIGDMKVMSYLSVFDKTNKQPLRDARVSLSFYDSTTRKYQLLTSELFKRIVNPSYTNSNGQISVLLPRGKYKATISAFGYDEKTVDFTIGPNPGEEFPQIYLQKNQTSVINFIRYYQTSITDFFINVTRFLNSLSLSLRFFNLIAFTVIGSFVLISFLLFTIRTHIRFTHIPAFFFHNLEQLFQKTTATYIYGVVFDENKQPVTKAWIECIDNETGNVVEQLTTNKLGKFYFRNNKGHSLKIIITKDGHMPSTVFLNPSVELPEHGVQITLQTGEQHHQSAIKGVLAEQAKNIAGLFFEFMLIFSLLLEAFFFTLFTFTSTFPFFALSLFNLLLWVFFMRERFEQKFMR